LSIIVFVSSNMLPIIEDIYSGHRQLSRCILLSFFSLITLPLILISSLPTHPTIVMWTHGPTGLALQFFSIYQYTIISDTKGKGKASPLQAWKGLKGSRRSRLPDFKTIGTWRC
jgi:hypothetical protein